MGGTTQTGSKNSNFLTTYARHMKFSELANITKRSYLTKFGGIKMGGSPSNGAAKILNFQTIKVRQIKFLELVDIKNKLNQTKIMGFKIGVNPKWGPPKFKLFNL